MASDDGNTARRIAFCSALCAGFAYVGYSVFTRFLNKKVVCIEEKSNKFSEDEKSSTPLNKSVQTDLSLTCSISSSVTVDCYEAAKTVRERVKDLNLRAQQFRKNSATFSPEFKPQSLQNSPWSSPRIIGSAKYLSYSAENICSTSPLASPEYKRRSKSPIIQGIQTKDYLSRSIRPIPDYLIANHKTVIEDSEITLKTLNNLYKNPREMTLFEIKNLTALLYTSNEDLLVKTLTTVSNCAAFTINQEQLCETGCAEILKELLLHQSEAVKVAVTQAISNVAVIDKSHLYFQISNGVILIVMFLCFTALYQSSWVLRIMNENITKNHLPLALESTLKSHIPLLLSHAILGGELLKTLSLTALANLALDNMSHKLMIDSVNSLLHLVETGSNMVQLQALHLMVNLSCNKDIIPSLLISKVSPHLFELIHIQADREITLRLLTFLANIVTFTTEDVDNLSGSSHTLFSALYNLKERALLTSIVELSSVADEDISMQARRLHEALVNKWY